MVNPIVFAIPLFFAAMGLELWLARRQGRMLYRTQDAMTSLHLGVLSQIVAVFAVGVNLGVYAAVQHNFALLSLDAGDPRVWIGALLLYDFLYYWKHRAGHEVHILWAAHVVHHSSEDYNLSTALRQPGTDFLLGWLFYLPMALLGVPVPVFVVVGLINLLYQFWPHTQLVGKLGWFDRVFCSPSNHRVHHGQNDYCLDRNYGGILILWDRLFGSFAMERDDEPVVYGVRKPLQSWNPLWGNLQVYAQILQGVRQANGVKARLMWLLAGPGWQPSAAAPASAFALRDFVRFDAPLSANLRRYAILSFGISAALLVHFLIAAPTLGPIPKALYGALLLLGMLGLSGVFSGTRPALVLELSRASVVLGALMTGTWFSPISALAQLAALLCLLASALLLGRALAPHERQRETSRSG